MGYSQKKGPESGPLFTLSVENDGFFERYLGYAVYVIFIAVIDKLTVFFR